MSASLLMKSCLGALMCLVGRVCACGRTHLRGFVLQEIQAVADSGAALDYCLHMWKHNSLPGRPPLHTSGSGETHRNVWKKSTAASLTHVWFQINCEQCVSPLYVSKSFVFKPFIQNTKKRILKISLGIPDTLLWLFLAAVYQHLKLC